ncbi:MAG: acyl-ACP--UDP-N-acetylglucosamine O-acyltransferase [Spirochaetota bacterium]|nr:acyl-ACP--UDP-N-acetylglucosamine O-acyltransferase [Spirochaetota bacterium]
MIHPTAIIDPQAEIDTDAEIGPYVVIEGPVRIARSCRVMAHVWLAGDTHIGEGCVLHPSCALGGAPQDISYDPNKIRSALVIGSGCEFRECVTIHRGAKDNGVTRIGSGVYLMAASHVGHDAHVHDGVIMANSACLGGYAVVGHKAFVSGNVSVHQHAHIGAYAMVGASTFVSQDIPPWCIVQGVPGRVAGLNTVGLRRNGFSAERMRNIKMLFRALYQSDIPFAAVKERIAAMDNDDARMLLEFLHSSQRGIAARVSRHVSE